MTRDLHIAAALMLAMEIVAQVAFPPPNPDLPGEGHTHDGRPAIMLEGNPYLLWELAPGEMEVSGGRAYVNELGFRDVERGDKTRKRAIALGDSSFYGFGVDDKQVFTAVLESRLDADFINGGVPGYSSQQGLNLLDLRGWELEPDLLVVCNLWSDNNFDSWVDHELMADRAEVTSTFGYRLRNVLSVSALFGWADWIVNRNQRAELAKQINYIRGPERQGIGLRRVPINRYAANLERYATEMHARGGGVLFLMPTNREDTLQKLEHHPWDPYRDVMRFMAERWNAPLVELWRVFPDRGGIGLFVDEIHPNAQGHQIMGEQIELALRARNWPAEPLQLTPPTTPLPTFEDPYEGRGVELGLVGTAPDPTAQ